MRLVFVLTIFTLFLSGCDESRVYQNYADFKERYWLIDEKPEFKFTISNTSQKYNLYCNLRNSTVYPYSRIFVNSSLQDSSGKELHKKLINEYLFDAKTGKPFGESGIGDLYDHQFLLLKDYQFPYTGNYKLKFEQFMRTDTLQGMLAVGLRVEKAEVKK